MPDSPSLATRRSRLAIIAGSVERLENDCRHIIPTAISRGNDVLCIAPGLADGTATSGPLQGATLANMLDAPAASPRATRRQMRQPSQALRTVISVWRPDTIAALGMETLPLARRAGRHIRLSNVHCVEFFRAMPTTEPMLLRWRTHARETAALKACTTHVLAHAHHHTAVHRHGPRLAVVEGPGADILTIDACTLPPIAQGLHLVAAVEPADVATRDRLMELRAALAMAQRAITLTIIELHPVSAAPDTALVPPDGIIAGNRETLLEKIRAAHAVLQLAATDHFPPALMAALAIGRPILAQDTPAHRRAIDERVNGILIDDGTVDTIGSGIKRLFSRPDLLTSMAAASRAKAERRFDAATLARAVIDHLRLR